MFSTVTCLLHDRQIRERQKPLCANWHLTREGEGDRKDRRTEDEGEKKEKTAADKDREK